LQRERLSNRNLLAAAHKLDYFLSWSNELAAPTYEELFVIAAAAAASSWPEDRWEAEGSHLYSRRCAAVDLGSAVVPYVAMTDGFLERGCCAVQAEV
jgi:hypothetical protein